FFLYEQSSWSNLKGWDHMIGHQETHDHPDFKQPANPTACPGSNWKVSGDNLYTRIVQDNWRGYPDPQPIQTDPPPPPPEPEPPVDPCEEAVNKAIAENDAKWQKILESAKQDNFKDTTWQEHLKMAYEKFVKKGGDK
ncbi:unnamed protein product, partial [marine sediment metagenome]